jgi:hypothetical protein
MSNTTLNIDLTKLTESQLLALSFVDQSIVDAELKRRKAFINLTEGFTRLRQAHLQLSNLIASVRKHGTAKDVVDTGIIEVIDRFIVTAEQQGLDIGVAPRLPDPPQDTVQLQGDPSPDADAARDAA